MVLKLTTILLFLCSLLFVTSNGGRNTSALWYPCANDLDCNRSLDHIRCGYCNRGKCEPIDQDVFRHTFPCLYNKKHCTKENPCKWPFKLGQWSHLQFEGYGDCVCFCLNNADHPTGYYGDRCQYKGQDGYSYPSGFQFIPQLHVYFNRPAKLLVSMKKSYVKPTLMVHDVIGGYVASIETKVYLDKYTPLDMCKSYFANTEEVCDFIKQSVKDLDLYVASFIIPFDWTTPPGENIMSFTRQIKMDPYWKHTRLSEHVRSYHLNYPDNYEDVPIIRFTDCGHNLKTIKKYKFVDDISLKANIYYVKNYTRTKVPEKQLHQNLFFKWEAYRVEGDTSLVRTSINTYITKYLSWDVGPFRWAGFYLVNLSATGIFNNGQKKETNFNICLVNVDYSPLVAVISGGLSRFVYREHGLELDASESKDFNSPPGKSKCQFTFTCNWTDEAVCQPYSTDFQSHTSYKIDPMVLQSDRVYNFTLMMTFSDSTKVKPAFANQIIFVGELGKNETLLKYDVIIRCIYNCGSKTNPKDIVYLRVDGPWRLLLRMTFLWTDYKFVENKIMESPVESIRQPSHSPSFILIIDNEQLKENSTYQFKVRLNNTSQFAMYPITTTATDTSLKCEIEPESGVAGLTKFRLSCSSTSAKLYEFYDKYETDEPGFSGRMFKSQETSDIEEFVLTRGKLEIISFDDYGMDSVFTRNVKIAKGDYNTADVKTMLDDLIKYSGGQSVGDSLETASVISDLLSSATEDQVSKSYLYNSLLHFLSLQAINRFDEAKIGISTLHNILLTGREYLNIDSAWHAAQTLHTLSKTLVAAILEGHLCTFKVLYKIIKYLLDCIYIELEVKEFYVGNETIPLQFDKPVVYMKMKKVCQHVQKTLHFLKSSLTYRQLSSQIHEVIKSSVGEIDLWVKADVPTLLTELIQKGLRHNSMFPVILSETFVRDINKMGNTLTLIITTFRQNPTWVAKTNTQHTIDVSVFYKSQNYQTCRKPFFIRNKIKVKFNVSNVISNIRFQNLSIPRPNPSLQDDGLDENLPVYRFDPMPSAIVEAEFKLDNEVEIVVLVKKDIRPTYEMLMTKGKKVSAASPKLHIVPEPSHVQHLYYMAIQPSAEIHINKTLQISFGVKIYSKNCYTFHDVWETRGCLATRDNQTDNLVCRCNRLSLIGGLVKEVPLSLDVVSDLSMLPTLRGVNTTLYLTLLLLLLSLLLFALICRKADRYERTTGLVSILPDNFPGDQYGYLVCVMTGARFGAGTDAAVGVQIYGTSNDGRRHVLTSKTHEVMGTRGEDWFLIYEPEYLGEISCLNIWHDNAGARPHWFCDSIVIYDLHHKNCYYFLVNDWITLSSKKFPQASLLPSTSSVIKSTPRVFLDYFKLGFHLSHVWLATVTRHARDPVTRVDRLAVIVSFTVVSMAVSITLINMYDEALEIDSFSYSLTWVMVEMGIYTCIIAAIVACVLMNLFRRIYTIIFYIEKHEGGKAHTKRVTRISIHADHLCSPSTMSLTEDRNYIHYGQRHELENGVLKKRTLCEIVNLMLMPKPLVPVRLERDDPNVNIDKIWLYTSWLTVSLITLGCLTMSILLSQNLPPVKTEKWLTVVALSILFHAFVLLPLKIVCVSTLLAVAFKRIIYKDVYTFDPSEGKQTNLFGNFKYLANLVHLRSQPTYQSLDEVFHEEHRQKMLRTGRLQRLYELLVQLLFLIVIGAILTSNISAVYQTNAHLHTLTEDFHKVHNTSDFHSYLREHCEPYLFRYIWYNSKLLSQETELKYFRRDWLCDSVTRMIEKVGLSQFRVKPDYCKTYLNLTRHCAAPFGRGSEDTNDYIPYWLRRGDLNETDELLGIELLSNWSYTRPSDDPNFSFKGETGLTYTSGGYKWDLEASGEEFSASLNKLLRTGWMGHYTRAVLAQIKVYNTNTRLFSEVTLIAEHTATGQILPTTVVHSVDTHLRLDWWLTVFIFMVFMFCARIIVLTNFVGVLALFENWHRVHELLMTINGLAVLVYLLLHKLNVPHYVTEYQLHAEELNSFNFYKIAHYYFTARALLCTLFILILLRFYTFWRFGRTVYRFFLTGLRSLFHIYWIFVTFLLFQLLTFRAVGNISSNFIDMDSNSNMFYRYNYPHFPRRSEVNGLNMLCYMLSYSSVVAMAMFVCVFVHHYKSVRCELLTLRVDNHFHTLYQEIKRTLSLPVIRVTHKLTDTMFARHEARKQKLLREMQSQAH